MEIVQITQPTQIHLREEFLVPYYAKGDPFESLLARSTYLTKYSRGNVETWTDTIRRVVEGNCSLAPGVTESEAELLFHLFWTGQALPPGRGLWTGGVEGIPADARFNCWYTTLNEVDDWCWTANQLMLGGGVGVGLRGVGNMPRVADTEARFAIWCEPEHENFSEVKPEGPEFLNGVTPKYQVADSREGWVTALRLAMTAAFEGTDLVIDVSKVRPRGRPIKTFGGVACGPGPLSHLLRSSWEIIRGAKGRKITSVEALDVTNHIGLCIKAGNVRRSALIVLGDPRDQAFRDAKKDEAAIKSHRHTSNNSIVFRSWDELQGFDWKSLVEDNVRFGEPGILNLPLVWKTDPGAMGVNPCFAGDVTIAVADGRNAVTIKQLAQEAKDVPVYSVNRKTGKVEIKMGRHPRITGDDQDLVRVWLDDGSHLDTTPNHKFILRDGTAVLAKDLEHGDSLPRFTKSLERVKKGSKDYYLVSCDTLNPVKGRTFEHRLIARFHSPEEWDTLYTECRQNGFTNTGGVVVHHKDFDQLNNAPDNLQIMSFRDHVKLHNEIDNTGEKNGRWSGVSNQVLKERALEFTRQLGRRFSLKDWETFAKKESLPQQFSKFRKQAFGSVFGLAELCASELGYEHVDEDPRVVRTFQSMLEQGYEARISHSRVLVKRRCEGCEGAFEVFFQQREHSFCSETCSNKHINSDKAIKAKRVASLRAVTKTRMEIVRDKQAGVCSQLQFDLGRDPIRKEWSMACKDTGLPSRIGPTLKYGFRHFNDVLEAGSAFNHKVDRVEVLPGKHIVYNITVDDFHTVGVITATAEKRGQVWYKGVYVGNCGEQALHDREACNLAEVFPAKFERGTDPKVVFRLITRYTLRNRLTPLSDPRSQAVGEKNMRVGVGLGGICDFAWKPQDLRTWFGLCRTEANNYADELKVNRPITVTTVKPSGTISLLNGSSPGIHAPHAPYYIRRTRIAKNDPMAEAMMQAGVPYEDCIYDKDGRTWVFSFPTAAVAGGPTKHKETIREQFERQVAIQENWADNAVSATLNFNAETEKEALAECLEEFVPRLKSTSCLASAHGYDQPPYETIDKATFEKMAGKIDHSNPLVNAGDIEIEECAGGACPIR